MKLRMKIVEEIAEVLGSVQPDRESITAAYDWLSVLRDELVFEAGSEVAVAVLDYVLGELVLMLVALSVAP